MMAYFLRAKSQLHCKMGPGFVHNFQEMTYLKPTFCEHCAGFVSLFSIISLVCSYLYSILRVSENNTPTESIVCFRSEVKYDGSLKLKN